MFLATDELAKLLTPFGLMSAASVTVTEMQFSLPWIVQIGLLRRLFDHMGSQEMLACAR
jgi:hypothetical protein